MSNIDKQGRQVQRFANYGVDMMEWVDGGYVKHSDYQALLDELEAKDQRLNEILKPNMLLPVIDDMDADNLRHVVKTASENYSLLHAKWEASENRAEAAEKRIAELEAVKCKLSDSKLLSLAKDIVEILVDTGGSDPEYTKQYVDWTFKRIRAAAGKGEAS